MIKQATMMIDAYGLKNLSIDAPEFKNFANGTGIPHLLECFIELKYITDDCLIVNCHHYNFQRMKMQEDEKVLT